MLKDNKNFIKRLFIFSIVFYVLTIISFLYLYPQKGAIKNWDVLLVFVPMGIIGLSSESIKRTKEDIISRRAYVYAIIDLCLKIITFVLCGCIYGDVISNEYNSNVLDIVFFCVIISNFVISIVLDIEIVVFYKKPNERNTTTTTKIKITFDDFYEDNIAYKYNKNDTDLRERIYINKAMKYSGFVYFLAFLTVIFATFVVGNVEITHIVISIVMSVLMIVINYKKLCYYDKNNRRLQIIESVAVTAFCVVCYIVEWIFVSKEELSVLLFLALFLLVPMFLTGNKMAKKQQELYAKKRKQKEKEINE